MKVQKTRDIRIVELLVPMFEECIKKGETNEYDLQSFLNWFHTNINNPNITTFVCVDDDTAYGYAIVNFGSSITRMFLSVFHIYSENDEGFSLLMDAIEKFAKANKINSIVVPTKFPKKFTKEHGFEVYTHVLKKEV